MERNIAEDVCDVDFSGYHVPNSKTTFSLSQVSTMHSTTLQPKAIAAGDRDGHFFLRNRTGPRLHAHDYKTIIRTPTGLILVEKRRRLLTSCAATGCRRRTR